MFGLPARGRSIQDRGLAAAAALEVDGKLSVFYSDRTDWTGALLQSWLRKRIRDYAVRRAEAVLPERLHMWEKEKNLYCDKVEVRRLPSRTLGRCDYAQRKIELSPRIILLPESHMDQVILHEMAHLVHHNHGRKFWEFLSVLQGKDSRADKVRADLESSAFYAYSAFLLK